MLPMLNGGKEQSIIEVLNVPERVLANQGPKRRKESIDSTFSTISPIVRIILEESFDKITNFGQLDLYNPLVAERARRILSMLDSCYHVVE